MAESHKGVDVNYDPNIRFAKQVVEITLQQWEYQKTYVVTLGGNCKGFDIFEHAIESLCEMVEGVVTLENPAGDELEAVDGDEEYEEWLKAMVISIRIVGIEAKD